MKKRILLLFYSQVIEYFWTLSNLWKIMLNEIFVLLILMKRTLSTNNHLCVNVDCCHSFSYWEGCSVILSLFSYRLLNVNMLWEKFSTSVFSTEKNKRRNLKEERIFFARPSQQMEVSLRVLTFSFINCWENIWCTHHQSIQSKPEKMKHFFRTYVLKKQNSNMILGYINVCFCTN